MDPQEHESIHAPRTVRVICIGAGASGLLLAYKLQKHFDQVTFAVYEKNTEVSGTWHENRYPGCACDVPAHNYTYSFDPKHDWSTVYAGSSEIKAYFTEFCKRFDLDRYIKTSHLVDEARWHEAEGEWEVEVLNSRDGMRFTERCDILICATGYLNNWRWPDISSIEKYKGALLHSANWQSEVNLEGKRVALIGNGASAIQILPNIQPLALHVTNFARSPLWVLPTIGSGTDATTPEQVERYRSIPGELLKRRKYNEAVMNSIYPIYLAESQLQRDLRRDLEASMRKALQNSELEKALIPTFGVGCRRLCPDTGYLQSIKKPNVKLVKASVTSLTERGCVDEFGEVYDADVVICATGFDTSFRPRFPIIGQGGENLRDIWNATNPECYLGLAVHGMPNLMMFLGPYTAVANGPTMASIEAQADYICRMIDRYQTEPIHSFQPSKSAQSDFVAHAGNFMKRTVLTQHCRSGHKRHTTNGRIPTVWPGSTLHYLQALHEVRGEDWDIRHAGNRFSFLGNGISLAEFHATCDTAYYIRERDENGLPLTRRHRMELEIRVGSQPPRELHRVNRPDVINLQ